MREQVDAASAKIAHEREIYRGGLVGRQVLVEPADQCVQTSTILRRMEVLMESNAELLMKLQSFRNRFIEQPEEKSAGLTTKDKTFSLKEKLEILERICQENNRIASQISEEL